MAAAWPVPSREPRDRTRAAGVGGHALTLGSGVLADLAQGGRDRGAQATRGRRRQVRDQAEAGLAHLLHGQHDPRLPGAARVTVVAPGDGPRHRRPFVVVGWVVVGGIVDRTPATPP